MILDLDLDFFLDDITYSRRLNRRLRRDRYHPWSEKQVRDFLEHRCGLSINRKVKGRVVKDHHEAFFFWKELIDKNLLEIPFEVVHIDGHADLGSGDGTWKYIMGELLHLPVEERDKPNKGGYYGLHEGNYLAFALVCRWINKLTFVLHSLWRYDLVVYYFKNYYVPSGILQLKKYNKKQLNRKFKKNFTRITPLALEPEVPFERVRYYNYKNNKSISFIILSHSPPYTPKTADALIPIIKEYINEI
ncbi:MAG: hypothetical protein ACFFD2_23025 [Promethearchaeota archaeon]